MKNGKTKNRLYRFVKMLCPVDNTLCGAEFVNEKDQVMLSCGHLRPFGLLPSRGVSIEDAMSSDPVRSALAQKLFPAPFPKRDLADVIGDVSQSLRETWR